MRLYNFMREVVNEFCTDNCPHLSASISFYVLLALFPLTLGIVSILGFFAASSDTERDVVKAISDFLPTMSSSEEDITDTIEKVANARGATSVIATIGLMWGGSAAFGAIRKSLNAAWGIRKPRPFFHERAMELGMMIGVGLILLASFAITTALTVAKNDESIAGISFFERDIFWNSIWILISASLSFITFLFLYKVIPNTKVRWSDVWGGALLAAVLFEGVKAVFIWYSAHMANYSSIYGPLGAIVAFLLWTYFSALILLFCAKVTAVYSRYRISLFEEVSWKSKRRLSKGIQAISPIPKFTPPNSFGTNTAFTSKSERKPEHIDWPSTPKRIG